MFSQWPLIQIAAWVISLTLQAAGIVGFAKGGRSMAWWLMVAGLCLSAVSCAIWIGLMWFPLKMRGPVSFSFGAPIWAVVQYSVAVFSSLLFYSGFAMQGMRFGAMSKRASELEGLCTALTQQLDEERRRHQG